MINSQTKNKLKRRLTGLVVSDKMQKTVVVEVTRFFKHGKYGKFIKRAKRYKVHDEIRHKIGEKVTIEECRPISKDKHFRIITIADAH